jgi:hypothetical protein
MGAKTIEDINTAPRPSDAAAPPVNVAPTPSRVLHVDATPDIVAQLCAQHGLGISTIEPLQSGGTRVVLNSSDSAENLRRRMKNKLIDGRVVRSSLHLARHPVPFT